MNTEKIIQEDEIDLVEVAKTIWSNRKFVLKIAGMFAVISLVIAFTSPIEYEASCKLLPESENSKMSKLGGLAGLAGLAGVDIGSMGAGGAGAITPQLYPEIVGSFPFVMEVINDTIYFEQKNINTTPFYYFKEIQKPPFFGYVLKYTIGLPGVIKDAFSKKDTESENPKSSEFIRLTKEEWSLLEGFKDRIEVEMNPETNIIEVTVEMPDPYAAAQLAKKIEVMITEAVIKYKTDKALKNLEFIQKTYNESKTDFEAVQLKLASAMDRNQNINSITGQIELKRIKHEHDIAFGVFKGLSSQVEQAKIKLKEETPVFTVLEPVKIPEGKSKPKRMIILVIMSLLGAFFAIIIILFKYIRKYA